MVSGHDMLEGRYLLDYGYGSGGAENSVVDFIEVFAEIRHSAAAARSISETFSGST